MILVLTPLREIGRRSHARECAKVAVEVGLIEVSAGEGDLSPIDIRLAGYETQARFAVAQIQDRALQSRAANEEAERAKR